MPGIPGYLAVICYYGMIWIPCGKHRCFYAIAALMLLMTVYVVTFPKFGTEQITVAFFGIFYVANHVFLSVPGPHHA